MTVEEARYVMAHKDEYSQATFSLAWVVLERAGEL
jgi:hypothetical protein